MGGGGGRVVGGKIWWGEWEMRGIVVVVVREKEGVVRGELG